MKLLALILGSLLLFCGRAEALTCSGLVSDIDFGSANLLASSATDTTATLKVTCTSIPNSASVKMCPGLSEGTAGASTTGRLMSSGASTLTYQLFQDASRTQPWGATENTSLGTVPLITLYGGSSGTATATRTIYARLYGGQTAAPPGAYVSDFDAAETAFRYSSVYSSTGSSCTGFTGSAVARPTFEVRASPAAFCRLSASDVAFGSKGVLDTASTATGTVKVACTAKTPYLVNLDNGRTGTGPTARKMTSSSSQSLTYGLYRDSAGQQPWGASGSSLGVGGTGTGSDQTLTVYGLVPAQTTPAPGAYADVVVATVTY